MVPVAPFAGDEVGVNVPPEVETYEKPAGNESAIDETDAAVFPTLTSVMVKLAESVVAYNPWLDVLEMVTLGRAVRRIVLDARICAVWSEPIYAEFTMGEFDTALG